MTACIRNFSSRMVNFNEVDNICICKYKITWYFAKRIFDIHIR